MAKMSKVSGAVQAIYKILDTDCGPDEMTRDEYVEVLEQLIDDFRSRRNATLDEMRKGK